MPLLKNAKKALRSSKRKTVFNIQVKSRLRTALKQAEESKSPETIVKTYAAIGRAVKRNLIHPNKAARLQSRVARKASSSAA
jgi:small subunit ribosomal protein S20